MPAYYDDVTKNWYCKFYYTDYTGTKKQKKKRGFDRQKDAKAWEREFLSKQQAGPSMSFKTFWECYLEDISPRLKRSTLECKINIVENRLLPFFSDMPMDEITPQIVRKWQNEMITTAKKDKERPSDSYLYAMNKQLKCIFNHAVTYYDLPVSPCKKAGNIGSGSAREMEFWTKDEFDQFIKVFDEFRIKEAFVTLYYTGMRVGELLALTWSDINLNKRIISITKTYHRFGREDVITTPKTKRSERQVPIPEFLATMLSDLKKQIYKPSASERVFPYTKLLFGRKIKKYAELAGLKIIRLHDLRHSHVSLLINLGYKPILIASRIGDSVEMVNKVYGHLYPNEHLDLVNKLDEINKPVPN